SLVAMSERLLSSSGLPRMRTGRIRELLSAGVDYYGLALARNGPMVDHTLALLEHPVQADHYAKSDDFGAADHNVKLAETRIHTDFTHSSVSIISSASTPSSAVAVLVAGGFHTSHLVKLFREKGAGVAVLTPRVDEAKPSDQALYVKRLTGIMLTSQEIQASSRHTIAVGNYGRD